MRRKNGDPAERQKSPLTSNCEDSMTLERRCAAERASFSFSDKAVPSRESRSHSAPFVATEVFEECGGRPLVCVPHVVGFEVSRGIHQ